MVKEGVIVVRAKAEELTEEGKRMLKVFELKTKVQKEISELGGKVYALSSKLKNPLLDKKVKPIIARIRKLEGQIARIEGKPRKASKKVTRRQTKSSKTK
jgi:peptidoglycan hydrolase CwlO-like protein